MGVGVAKAFRDILKTFVKSKYERSFEKELALVLRKSPKTEELLNEIVHDSSVFQKDPERYGALKALIIETLEKSEDKVASSIKEGLNQPSELGREKYVAKLLRNTEPEITGTSQPRTPTKDKSKSEKPNPTPERSYQIGYVGAGARVAQGENISWIEGVADLPEGETLARQFAALLDQIDKDASLDDDTRALAKDKTAAVAEGLAKAQESPGVLRRALIDAKSWFGSSASGVGNALGDILKSEAAQETLGTVSEAATRAAIDAFVK
ncbi:hypothetical protein [Paraburkholderia ribeironis]|nr:hypothetical protein [Paraburkholderia ribeironis]